MKLQKFQLGGVQTKKLESNDATPFMNFFKFLVPGFKLAYDQKLAQLNYNAKMKAQYRIRVPLLETPESIYKPKVLLAKKPQPTAPVALNKPITKRLTGGEFKENLNPPTQGILGELKRNFSNGWQQSKKILGSLPLNLLLGGIGAGATSVNIANKGRLLANWLVKDPNPGLDQISALGWIGSGPAIGVTMFDPFGWAPDKKDEKEVSKYGASSRYDRERKLSDYDYSRIVRHQFGTTKGGIQPSDNTRVLHIPNNGEATYERTPVGYGDFLPLVGTYRAAQRIDKGEPNASYGDLVVNGAMDLLGAGMVGSVIKAAGKANRIHKALKASGFRQVGPEPTKFIKVENITRPNMFNPNYTITTPEVIAEKTIPNVDYYNVAMQPMIQTLRVPATAPFK